MADELLAYRTTRQGTTVNHTPEVRTKKGVDGRASMTSSSTDASSDSLSDLNAKVGGTDEDK